MFKLIKIMIWTAALFIMFLIATCGIICYLAYSVIEQRPFDVPVRIPDMNASASVYRKLDLAGTLLSAFKNPKKRGDADKAKEVELNGNEVNAMLISGLVFAEQAMAGKDGGKELRDAYFARGAFTVMLSKKIIFKTPFGSYLNLGITFVPGIRNRHFSAEAKGIRIGSIDIPVSALKNKIDSALYKMEKTPDGEAILDIVSELKVEEDKLTIVYSPEKLLKYMMKKGYLGGDGMSGGDTVPVPVKE
jgi:hypothetical protein